MKIGDLVKIKNDIWKQKHGKIVCVGKTMPGLQYEYDFYVQTESAGIIGYFEADLELEA